MKVFKEFRFEAAHFLPYVPEGHKCGRMHGHSYKVRVEVSGPVGHVSGWVIDYADVGSVVKPVIDALDHTVLNETRGLENSTAEALAIYIWSLIYGRLPGLSKIEIYETATSGVVYCGEKL